MPRGNQGAPRPPLAISLVALTILVPIQRPAPHDFADPCRFFHVFLLASAQLFFHNQDRTEHLTSKGRRARCPFGRS